MKISGQGGAAPPARRELDDRGYILVVLLVSMAVAAVWMSAALPAWRQQSMREKELDLIFRGEQYARAIALYQIKNNSYPLDIDVLVSQRYLRKKWKDPVTGEDFQLVGLTSGQGGTPNRSGVPGGVAGVSPGSTSRGGTPVGPGGMTQVPGGAPGRGPAQPSLGGQPLIGRRHRCPQHEPGHVDSRLQRSAAAQPVAVRRRDDDGANGTEPGPGRAGQGRWARGRRARRSWRTTRRSWPAAAPGPVEVLAPTVVPSAEVHRHPAAARDEGRKLTG